MGTFSQAYDCLEKQKEYTMGEGTSEDQCLSPGCKNIWVGASRKGCCSGSGIWRESLPEETAYARPGTLETVGGSATGSAVKIKRGRHCQGRAQVKLKANVKKTCDDNYLSVEYTIGSKRTTSVDDL